MARTFAVSFIDDLNGEKANETVRFGLDGKVYEIDLSSQNAQRLRAVLGEYLIAARQRRRSVSQRAGSRLLVERKQNQSIRDWARKQGIFVSDRGRIPAGLAEAYRRRT